MCATKTNIQGGNMEAALLSLLKDNKESQSQIIDSIQKLQLVNNTMELKIKTMEEFISRVTTSDAYTLPVCAQSRQDMFSQVNKSEEKIKAYVTEQIASLNKKLDSVVVSVEENKNKSKIDLNEIFKKVIYVALSIGVGYLFTHFKP